MDHTSDELERASNIALAHDKASVDAVRKLAAPQQDPNNLEPDCEDCGEEIEKERLDHLYARCFRCQNIREKKDKLYARK